MKKKSSKIASNMISEDPLKRMTSYLFELEKRIVILEKCAASVLDGLKKHLGEKNGKRKEKLDAGRSKKARSFAQDSESQEREEDYQF